MKTQYRAVVVGGGVVGTSLLYHLCKMGWEDSVLLEKLELFRVDLACCGFASFVQHELQRGQDPQIQRRSLPKT